MKLAKMVALNARAMPGAALAQACPPDYAAMASMLRESSLSRTEYRDGVTSTYFTPAARLRFLGAQPTQIKVADLYGPLAVSISLPGSSIAPYEAAYKAIYPSYSSRAGEGLMFQIPRKGNKLSEAILQSMSYQASATLLCHYSSGKMK